MDTAMTIQNRQHTTAAYQQGHQSSPDVIRVVVVQTPPLLRGAVLKDFQGRRTLRLHGKVIRSLIDTDREIKTKDRESYKGINPYQEESDRLHSAERSCTTVFFSSHSKSPQASNASASLMFHINSSPRNHHNDPLPYIS